METFNTPSLKDAVRSVVARRRGIWTVADLHEALAARGWRIAALADRDLTFTLARLCACGEARRVRCGAYAFGVRP